MLINHLKNILGGFFIHQIVYFYALNFKSEKETTYKQRIREFLQQSF